MADPLESSFDRECSEWALQMQGCFAPSEVPGVSAQDAATFGAVAEDLIYVDFHARYSGGPWELFRDANNPSSYLAFLAYNNPSFDKQQQLDYFRRLQEERLMRVPDFLVHRSAERSFYEVKPDSISGRSAGVEKVGTLLAVYKHYNLPYIAGRIYEPRDTALATLGSVLRVILRVRRFADGLLVYRICLESECLLEMAVVALLLRLVVGQVNGQRGTGKFRPVELLPLLQSLQLGDLARALGYSAAGVTGVVAARATWRHFWGAVMARFAVRGAAAATLSLADGPLPVGDLLAVGMTLVTVIDIVRFSDDLWREAENMARRGV